MSAEHQQTYGRAFECVAADFSDVVDATLNSDAIAEAADALRGGTEVTDHGVYLDSATTVEFDPRSEVCRACSARVELLRSGSIEAPACLASETCVVTTAAISPGTYLDARLVSDSKWVPCRAIGCGAIIGVTKNGEAVETTAIEGVCAVERHEENNDTEPGWHKRQTAAIAEMSTVPAARSLQSDGYMPNGNQPLV